MGIFDFFKKKQKRRGIKCSSCGEMHDELSSLGFITPLYYDILSDNDKKQIAEVSSDFCVIRHEDQTDRFIRTVLTIQINDACENLDYGIWVSLSKASFDDYQANFKTELDEVTYFGMICNEIPDYTESTLGLHVNVNTRKGGIRPIITPHQVDHQLFRDWEAGITIIEAEKRVELMMTNLKKPNEE